MKRITIIIGGVCIVGAICVFFLTRPHTASGPSEASSAGITDVTLFFGDTAGSSVSHASTSVDSAREVRGNPPEGYVEYRNTAYGFSLYRPKAVQVSEFNEGGGAMTFVLQNVEEARGLQIYVVPYAGNTITEQRFMVDVPSGVRENVEETLIDGVRAVTFTSHDDFLGDTRELWFIHNGYLYELTTFKGLADWFAPIVQSWRFI